MKKETFEDWRAAGVSLALQTKFAADQVNKFIHLLNTQSTAGNLPQVIQKWQKLHTQALNALNTQIARGVRWKFCTETEAAFLLGIEQINGSSLIS